MLDFNGRLTDWTLKGVQMPMSSLIVEYKGNCLCGLSRRPWQCCSCDWGPPPAVQGVLFVTYLRKCIGHLSHISQLEVPCLMTLFSSVFSTACTTGQYIGDFSPFVLLTVWVLSQLQHWVLPLFEFLSIVTIKIYGFLTIRIFSF